MAVSESFKNLSSKLTGILGPDGVLAQNWPSYQFRPQQLEMSKIVARAFVEDDFALVEAGTGTGKTLAYLLPALLSGKKTVVSTGTKNLQEQIFEKDIPFIRANLGSDFKAAYLKGRENYLCLHFYKSFMQNPAMAVPGEVSYLDTIREWAAETETGDKAGLTELPEGFQTWSDISAPSDKCLGGKCPEYEDCFLMKARRKAAAADIVVVNHHLFMSDLAIRDSGFGEVIPRYEAIIFDEAHDLEDVATLYFGVGVSTRQLFEFRRDLARLLAQNKIEPPEVQKSLNQLDHETIMLARANSKIEGEFELWANQSPEMDLLVKHGKKTMVLLESLAGLVGGLDVDEEEKEALALRAKNLSGGLMFIIEARDSDYVYWGDQRKTGLFLKASPVNVGPQLQDRLYSQGRTIVFTSATLTAERSFNYFKKQLGIFEEVEGDILDSPFDYERESLLYVPRGLPEPAHKNFLGKLLTELESLLKTTRGRAFVLFTSYRHLNWIGERLPEKLEYTCLIQGQAPKSVLLEQFRRDVNSVLLATQSFWQGVDVPGESLSAVIIDKLPFAPPGRPLIKARLQNFEKEGQDPFLAYQVPAAIIDLKQGLGRLIRTEKDHGLLAIMDTRLVHRDYGKKFLLSLPPSPLTRDRDRVASFFDTRSESGST